MQSQHFIGKPVASQEDKLVSLSLRFYFFYANGLRKINLHDCCVCADRWRSRALTLPAPTTLPWSTGCVSSHCAPCRLPFLYRDGSMLDLGPFSGPWSEALAINDLSQVVGFYGEGVGSP